MIKNIGYKVLKDANSNHLLTQYEELVFPASKKAITANNQPLVSLVAFHEDKPVGLLITQLKKDKTAELLSLCVKDEFQKQGIANRLLLLTEKFLLQIGAKHIDLTYLNTYNQTETLEKLLAKQDWLTPKPTVLNIKLNNKNVFKANWVLETLALQNEVEVFDWKDLTESDKQEVIKIQQHKDFPKHLTPFQLEEILDRKVSKGARVNGQIVGWCILHNISDRTNQCSALYIDNEYRKKAIGEQLMANCFDEMIKKNIDFTIYQAQYKDKALTSYLNLLFAEHDAIIQKAETMASRKYLIN